MPLCAPSRSPKNCEYFSFSAASSITTSSLLPLLLRACTKLRSASRRKKKSHRIFDSLVFARQNPLHRHQRALETCRDSMPRLHFWAFASPVPEPNLPNHQLHLLRQLQLHLRNSRPPSPSLSWLQVSITWLRPLLPCPNLYSALPPPQQ